MSLSILNSIFLGVSSRLDFLVWLYQIFHPPFQMNWALFLMWTIISTIFHFCTLIFLWYSFVGISIWVKVGLLALIADFRENPYYKKERIWKGWFIFMGQYLKQRRHSIVFHECLNNCTKYVIIKFSCSNNKTFKLDH